MLNVLVIDDDNDIRYALKRIISRCGYKASGAESGEEAFSMLSRETYDVVFCDMRFPSDMPGDEILKNITVQHPKTKVIMMSCAMDQSIKKALIKQGASDGIQKPFFQDTCSEMIQSLYPPLPKAA